MGKLLLCVILLVVGRAADSWGKCPLCCGECWDPCPCPCWVTGFEIFAEFLYVRPHQADLNYGIRDTRSFGDPSSASPTLVDEWLPDGTLLAFGPHYEAAFRVGISYLFNGGCNDLRIHYTGLWTHDSQLTAASGEGGLWITNGSPRYNGLRLNNGQIAALIPGAEFELATPTATARQRVRIEHEVVDAEIAARRWCGRRLWTRPFAGIRWADICIREDADYLGVVTFVGTGDSGTPVRVASNQLTHVHTKSETWGIGPLMGIDLRFTVVCGLGIDVHFGTSLLVGRPTHHMIESDLRASLVEAASQSDVDEELNLRGQNRWQMVPNFDARLGLSYLHRFGQCFDLCLECGWEFVSFVNAMERVHLMDRGGVDTLSCTSFNLDGLYVGLRLTL